MEIKRLYSEIETMKQAKIEAANRHLNRTGSVQHLRNHPGSMSSLRSQSIHGHGDSTPTLGNNWKNSQYFSPTAELVSDFV